MSITLPKLHPQYVTDAQGNRTSALLKLDEYESLLEELDDLREAVRAQGEPSIPWEKVKQDLGLQ